MAGLSLGGLAKRSMLFDTEMVYFNFLYSIIANNCTSHHFAFFIREKTGSIVKVDPIDR